MMAKFNDLLHLRFKQRNASPTNKVSALVERANNGELSSFSGIFRIAALNEKEKETIAFILNTHRVNESISIDTDFLALSVITSEVKAIANQAVILHGERIKRAQELLKKYQDGAFTAWLYATYGNRQTPYNFLQYYEFYTSLPQSMHPLIDQMPRQVVYSLASRNGPLERKIEIVKSYSGQPKQELLKLIRIEFPLEEDDKRLPNLANHVIGFLKRARETFKNPLCKVSYNDKEKIRNILFQIQQLIEK
ncbi:MAG TPA: CT583 family protein [Chlamydiales bacterium]|nr:CT583 family protein [Chlamydiales bacterium]